jgi:hypothetical protein
LAQIIDLLSFLPRRRRDSNSTVEIQELPMVSLGLIRRAFLLFVAGVGCVALAQVPATTEQTGVERITAQEEGDTLAALKPPKRQRPVVAVLGLNEGSETTDYLVPFGVLRRSDLADVFALSIRPGPVTLMPSLTIVPDMTTTEFDQRFPDGADYVIVPAMHVADDATVLKWIEEQAAGKSNRRGRVRRRTRSRQRGCSARQERDDALVPGERIAQGGSEHSLRGGQTLRRGPWCGNDDRRQRVAAGFARDRGRNRWARARRLVGARAGRLRMERRTRQRRVSDERRGSRVVRGELPRILAP